MTAGLPLVSVIVPAYNAERTLEETLRSAAAQTHAPLEIVIVDDGSTDATRDVARSFCAAEPRARLIEQENRGVAAARNVGIRASRGAYLAPLDADDIWHPTKIARQVGVALAAPEPPGFVYCWFRTIDARSHATGCGEAWIVRGHALDRLAYRNVVGNGSGLLLSRAAVDDVGGYDERRGPNGVEGCEDLLIQFAIARRYPIDLVEEYLVGYRVGQGGLSSDAERMYRAFRTVSRSVDAESEVSARARRWNLAHRQGQLAERRAIRRDFSGSARLFLSALRLDPTRSSLYLAYRTVRSLRRLVWRRGRGQRILHFAMWPVDRGGPHDPLATGWLASRLAARDHRRMRRLAGGQV
jgi:glycosyltransferase involved in cell wall biosynthesis